MKKTISRLGSRYRYSFILLKELVITDFKLRYQGSVLGYVWSLLRPLALFVILYVVFVKFLPIGRDVPHFPVYLLLGIVLWNYFADVTNGGVKAIVEKGELLRKLNFPRYTIVLASSVSALINLLINLVVVAAFMVVSDVDVRMTAVYIIPLVAQLFVFSLAVAFFLSAVYVRFRDVAYIWEVGMQAAFYATPILYPLSKIPEQYGQLLIMNPVAQIIQDARYALISPTAITVDDLYQASWVRLVPLGITLLLVVVAALYFKWRSRHFAEEI